MSADTEKTERTPTHTAYDELQTAFDHFNKTLFRKALGKALPQCLITLQRHNRALGYYCAGRFAELNGDKQIDEIAMNPVRFRERTIEQTLSTLVHEMAHQYQEHFGKPSRKSYHNAEWGAIMESVGLMPSSTGAVGGKRTGQQMTHYAIEGGLFTKSCADLLTKKFRISWGDRFGSNVAVKTKKTGNRSNRIKYRCPTCEANAWGKPELMILCGGPECNASPMEQAEAEELLHLLSRVQVLPEVNQ